MACLLLIQTGTAPKISHPLDTMAAVEMPELRAPADLSHHFNTVSRARMPNQMKGLYKYFRVPGMTNLAGGGVSAAGC